MSKLLTAEEILAASDLATVDVEVPEWGGTVRLRQLSAGETITFSEAASGNKKLGTVKLIAMSAVDESGNRLFTDKQVEALKSKSIKIFVKLQKIALELNGFTEKEEALKND